MSYVVLSVNSSCDVCGAVWRVPVIYMVLCVDNPCDRCGALGGGFLSVVVVLCGVAADNFMCHTFICFYRKFRASQNTLIFQVDIKICSHT